MYVTVRLRPDARAATGDASELPADLVDEAADLGVMILPMHPGIVDEQLSRYYYVELDDPSRAEDVAERLGRIRQSTAPMSSRQRAHREIGAKAPGKGETDMPRRRGENNGPRPRIERPVEPSSPAELIVVARPEAGLRARPGAIDALGAADASSLESILNAHGAAMEPLFGVPEERLLAFAADFAPGFDGPPEPGSPRALAKYYHVDAPASELNQLAKQLQAHAAVEAAYVKPPTTLAVGAIETPKATKATQKVTTLNDMQPAAGDAPPVTPDFTASQQYLDHAPTGIDARYAWTLPGGGGAGVRVIDCEWWWNLGHEDLLTNRAAWWSAAAPATRTTAPRSSARSAVTATRSGITGIARTR